SRHKAPLSVGVLWRKAHDDGGNPSSNRRAPPPATSGHRVILKRFNISALSKPVRRLPLASTMMSPPCFCRRALTNGTRSLLTMREFSRVASFKVEENTIFSTELSHRENARSRGSAVSSLVTAGQYPPKPW